MSSIAGARLRVSACMRLGVGLRRVPARRFICGISALHSRHGGGAERL